MSIGADFYREHAEQVTETWLKLFKECETLEDYKLVVMIIEKYTWL